MSTTQQILFHGEAAIELKIPLFPDLPLRAAAQRLDRYHESSLPDPEIGKPLVDTPLLTALDIRQRIWQELQQCRARPAPRMANPRAGHGERGWHAASTHRLLRPCRCTAGNLARSSTDKRSPKLQVGGSALCGAGVLEQTA